MLIHVLFLRKIICYMRKLPINCKHFFLPNNILLTGFIFPTWMRQCFFHTIQKLLKNTADLVVFSVVVFAFVTSVCECECVYEYICI